jgi:hypothetical protein
LIKISDDKKYANAKIFNVEIFLIKKLLGPISAFRSPPEKNY